MRARSESRVEAVQISLFGAYFGTGRPDTSLLDHDHTIFLPTPFPDLIKYLIGDIPGEVIEMPGIRMRQYDGCSSDLPI